MAMHSLTHKCVEKYLISTLGEDGIAAPAACMNGVGLFLVTLLSAPWLAWRFIECPALASLSRWLANSSLRLRSYCAES